MTNHSPRSLTDLRDETSAYLRGEIPKPDWLKAEKKPLSSRDEVLNPENVSLMKLAADHRHCTVSELADMSGREMWSVSRSLQDLARFGFVRFVRTGSSFHVEVTSDKMSESQWQDSSYPSES